MKIEEKIEKAKLIYSKLECSIEEFKITRIEDLNADFLLPMTEKRGIGGIIIGDDGSYLICGSIYPQSYYIEEFKNGKRDDMK